MTIDEVYLHQLYGLHREAPLNTVQEVYGSIPVISN